MAKLRSVSVNFWDDPFIEELSTSEKLLFLYLITNDKTNMIGVYESSSKKMSFETGIPQSNIETILTKFEKAKKIKRVGSYVVVLNFIKNQNFNPNMMKSAIDTYNALPKELKANDIIIGKESLSNGLERVRNGLAMVRKVEVEYKVESKYEREDESKPPNGGGGVSLNEFDFAPPLWHPLLIEWATYREKIKKKLPDLQKTFSQILKLSNNNIEIAQKIIDQSIANGWQGLFELKPTHQTYEPKLTAAERGRQQREQVARNLTTPINIDPNTDFFKLPPPRKTQG